MKKTHGSLFSGIGAPELASEWMGWKNLFHCEINDFCRSFLEKRFKGTSYADITKTDFTNLPFEDNSFYMVVFDPPHLKTLGETSWMAKKYGKLPSNWQEVIKAGFDECMRVLKPNGTLVFKWNESEIKAIEILSLIPYEPLFGHTTGRQSKTIWMCFMKLPID